MKGKNQPSSIEAERSVLGAIIVDPELAVEILSVLTPEDYYDRRHRLIFEACVELDSRNSVIDLVTLDAELKKRGSLEEAGGIEYLADLAQEIPTSSGVHSHVEIIRDKSLLRQLLSVSNENIREVYETSESARAILDRAETRIFRISERLTSAEFVELKDLVDRSIATFERLRDAQTYVTGLASGFSELDAMTTGFHAGELVIVAARPSVGKTSFALNMAEHMALNQNVKVGFFSLEMSNDQLAQRLVRSNAGISRKAIMSGTLSTGGWQDLINAADRLSRAPIFIDDTAGIHSMELRARARHLKKREDIGVIFVDYLQLMRSSRGENRQQEIASISADLKALAKELEVPVIALSQLSRRAVAHEGSPRLSDLRESGAIEQDADVVLFLHDEGSDEGREEYGFESRGMRDTLLKIGKQRNGPRGEIHLLFDAPITRFYQREDDR